LGINACGLGGAILGQLNARNGHKPGGHHKGKQNKPVEFHGCAPWRCASILAKDARILRARKTDIAINATNKTSVTA
jgi:hypothetical protein